ncbi:MAG: hypothetical protein V5A18_09175 [Haloarculaceae archaeon]
MSDATPNEAARHVARGMRSAANGVSEHRSRLGRFVVRVLSWRTERARPGREPLSRPYPSEERARISCSAAASGPRAFWVVAVAVVAESGPRAFWVVAVAVVAESGPRAFGLAAMTAGAILPASGSRPT